MRQRAFTLIEALISIALIALVLPVALAGVAGAGHAAGAAHREQLALLLAQNKLNALEASGDWSAGSSAGDFDPAVDGAEVVGFHYQVAVLPWRDPNVRALTVTVSWDPALPKNQVALNTLVVTPATTAATTTAAGGTP